MHLDLQDATGAVDRATQVCIVGCGPAGITAARRLLALGHTVLMLESGGLDYEPAVADLNAGETIGEPYYDLANARLRLFGGTTAIWGGRLAELDPIDLQRRSWVPHSGWPMAWEALQPYYPAARRQFDLAGRASAERLIAAGVPLPDFDPARLDIGVWTFDRRVDRFAFAACEDLVRHPRCTVVTHATVTGIARADGGRRVAHLQVRALTGQRLTVRAHAYVLAAGGLENPRLLLASGIGAEHDQVGRYFMEHPHARGGRVLSREAWALLKAFGRTHSVDGLELAALIKPAAQAQASRRILNSSLTLAARPSATASRAPATIAYERLRHGLAPDRRNRALWLRLRASAKALQRSVDPLRPWLLHRLGLRDIALVVRAEQAPNPASRVTLTREVDALGLPRLALDWRLSELDVVSVARLVDLLAGEMRRLGFGRIERAAWLEERDGWLPDPVVSTHPFGGYHHMGTTRMSDGPHTGVVDADGRVHGLANLYVLGSSVFPTAGWANPTLTIAALSLRTSDRLSAALLASKVA